MNRKVIPNLDFFTLVEQELDETGSVLFIVQGTSMQPMLRNGKDKVLLVKVGEKGLRPGDICLFRHCGKHILHRLIRRDGNDLYMRGDNVIGHCDICRPEDVAGIVETVYRNERRLSPTSKKWKTITGIHRLTMKVKRPFAIIYHKLKGILQHS